MTPYRDKETGEEFITQLIETEDCECEFFTVDNVNTPKCTLKFEDVSYLWWSSNGEVCCNYRGGDMQSANFLNKQDINGYFIDDLYLPLHRVAEVRFKTTTYKKLLKLKKEE